MIHLSAATAAMLYLILTMGGMFALWIYHHLQSKKKKILSNREELYLCEYCHYAYVSDPLKKINQCPECKSYNKDNHYHKAKPPQ